MVRHQVGPLRMQIPFRAGHGDHRQRAQRGCEQRMALAVGAPGGRGAAGATRPFASGRAISPRRSRARSAIRQLVTLGAPSWPVQSSHLQTVCASSVRLSSGRVSTSAPSRANRAGDRSRPLAQTEPSTAGTLAHQGAPCSEEKFVGNEKRR